MKQNSYPIDHERSLVIQKHFDPIFEKSISVKFCQYSNCAYLDEIHTSDVYKKYYEQDWSKKKRPEKLAKKSIERSRRMLELLNEGGASFDSHTRALEIGTGYGFALKAFREVYSCHLFGIEPSAEASDYASNQLGLTILGPNIDVLGPHDTFDYIFLIHVFEHLTAPDEFLSRIAAHCNETGMLYLEVPDVFAGALPHFEHPFAHSIRSLSLLLKRHGFEVLGYKNRSNTPEYPTFCSILAVKGIGVGKQNAVAIPASIDMDEYRWIYRKRLIKKKYKKIINLFRVYLRT